MRYERKYKLENASLALAEQALRLHPAGFRPLFQGRWVNNLYFDSPSFDAFQDNVVGAPQRVKYRIRWYGRPFSTLEKPVLERKSKEGEVGYKKSFTLPPGPHSLSDMPKLVDQARHELWKGKEIQPVLFNSYYRTYWSAYHGRFRITIDRQMQFAPYTAREIRRLPFQAPGLVIEVKYGLEEVEESDFILQHLPFRQTKSSKYVTGVNLCYGSLI